MTRIANPATRPYRSSLRAEQAEETRSRVLDAALRVMESGVASLSIPAVAREAGVSVPTVYRHFGTKADLLAQLYPHVARRHGLDRLPDPASLDDFRTSLRAIFERVDALDDLARAAMASPVADEVRHATIQGRFERLRRLGDSIEPRLSTADHDRITRLLVVLTASASLRMWRDHLGSSVDEAVDDIDWILKAAVAAARPEESR
jgi:AcrR family transcriptional regulator